MKGADEVGLAYGPLPRVPEALWKGTQGEGVTTEGLYSMGDEKNAEETRLVGEIGGVETVGDEMEGEGGSGVAM